MRDARRATQLWVNCEALDTHPTTPPLRRAAGPSSPDTAKDIRRNCLAATSYCALRVPHLRIHPHSSTPCLNRHTPKISRNF